jgi:hypothetical protein
VNDNTIADEGFDPRTGLVASEVMEFAEDRRLRFGCVETDFDLTGGCRLNRRRNTCARKVRFE